MSLEKLLKAIEGGNVKNALQWLNKFPSLAQQQDEDGVTPLMMAVGTGNIPITECLLRLGADPLKSDNEGYNALWVARENGIGLEICKKLVIKTVQQHLPMAFKEIEKDNLAFRGLDRYCVTLLENSQHPDDAFLYINSDIRLIDQLMELLDPGKKFARSTLLKWAVTHDCGEIVKQLLTENPFRVNKADAEGKAALHWAAEANKPKMVAILLEFNPDETLKDSHNKTAADYLSEQGEINLSKEITRRIAQKTYRREQRAQTKFFNRQRNNNPEIGELTNKFFNNWYAEDATQKVISDNEPRRTLVAADAAALEQVLDVLPADEQRDLTSTTAIFDKLGINKTGTKFGNREKIQFGDTEINYQHNPVPGQMGNFFMSGIGTYGLNETSDVLQIINELTRTQDNDLQAQAENEKKLARLLLSMSKTGNSVTTVDLQNIGITVFSTKKLNDQYLKYLHRLSYLISVKEVTRRMHQGVRSDGKDVPELPFAVAYYRALKLVAEGHLRMQDIFAANAAYGLPTDVNIMATDRKIGETYNKLTKLNQKYEEHFPHERISTEQFHQELLLAYGGEADTSGEEYSSDDEVSKPRAPRG